MRRGALGIACALLAGAVHAQGAAPAPPAPVAVAADYRLDTDDALLIEVARHADITRTVRIPADGTIRLPRLDRPILARGLTCDALVALLEERLTREGKLKLRRGQVQVSVVAVRPSRIYLRGNAVLGRELAMKPGWRLSELIAAIGGLPQADRVLARLTNPLRPRPVEIDLTAIERDPSSPANVELMEGDTLTVDAPRRKRLFVTGEGPRGEHELDERFGLRRALIKMGITVRDNPGDLRQAILKRKTVPGDPNAPEIRLPVDLVKLLTDDSAPEVPLEDMDTLDIPAARNFIYLWGADGSARRWILPQDRPTRLLDIFTTVGGVPGNGKIGEVGVWRYEQGVPKRRSYDLGRYLRDGKMEQNPLIQPEDIVIVPANRRVDPFQSLWTAVGAVQALTFLRSTLLK